MNEITIHENRLRSGQKMNADVSFGTPATIGVYQENDFLSGELRPVEITVPAWNGTIEGTKEFIAALQAAVVFAEGIQ